MNQISFIWWKHSEGTSLTLYHSCPHPLLCIHSSDASPPVSPPPAPPRSSASPPAPRSPSSRWSCWSCLRTEQCGLGRCLLLPGPRDESCWQCPGWRRRRVWMMTRLSWWWVHCQLSQPMWSGVYHCWCCAVWCLHPLTPAVGMVHHRDRMTSLQHWSWSLQRVEWNVKS